MEKELATHYSILAWEIPWTEEPGAGYSPWGCKSWTRLSDYIKTTFLFYKNELFKIDQKIKLVLQKNAADLSCSAFHKKIVILVMLFIQFQRI